MSAITIIVVFILDLIAFGLGIGAEQRRATGTMKTDDSGDYQWCQYDSDIASGLAVGALLFLLTGQIVIGAVTRCLCCGSSLRPGAARAFAVIFFILNWICFIIAGSCFLAGAVENAKHIRYFSIGGTIDLTCEAIRKDTFAAGVAFTFFGFITSVAYYLSHSKAQVDSWKNQFNNRGDAGVHMASYS